MLIQWYVSVFYSRGKHLHNRLILLRGMAWAFKIKLAHQWPFIKVPVQCQVIRVSDHVYVC
jgi:hypothetical protein